ncbi:MAG: hypothetical protein C5B49_15365 [Bdellovibrio sp.]|nr:MAG: hypothetical protein C5B49_15365 [Bdellovibrio sp.]
MNKMRALYIILSLMITAAKSSADFTPIEEKFDRHLLANPWKSGFVIHSNLDEGMPYGEWEKRPESSALKLFPEFVPAHRENHQQGAEKQTIVEARSTFIIQKPTSALNLQNMISDEKWRQTLDPAVTNEVIGANRLFINKQTNKPFNASPRFDWCRRSNSICIQSEWVYPDELQPGMKFFIATKDSWEHASGANIIEAAEDLYNTGLGPDAKHVLQSELSVLSPAELAMINDSHVIPGAVTAGIQQSTFYSNRIARWMKNLVLFQPDPGQPTQTRVAVVSVFAVSSDYYNRQFRIPFVGTTYRFKDWIMGRTDKSAQFGDTLASGIPHYTAAIAQRLARKLSE